MKLKIINNFFNEYNFNIIKNECESLNYCLRDETFSFAKNRSMVKLDTLHFFYNLFYSPEILFKIKKETGLDLKYSDLTPIEYRKYNLNSSMGWHKDTVLSYNGIPQFEMVFSVVNNSDSKTYWIEPNTENLFENVVKNQDLPDNNALYEIQSQPNSAILLQADDIYHCVSTLYNGNRTIIKVVYELNVISKCDT